MTIDVSFRRPFRATAIVSVMMLAPLRFSVVHAQTVTGTSPSGLFYEVSGSGEPVVFIHAFSVDRRMWEPQIDAFEDQFQIVRYDLRGHGRSVPPTEAYTGYDDLRELLDVLGITRATLVGVSAGSELAVNFAIDKPARNGSGCGPQDNDDSLRKYD